MRRFTILAVLSLLFAYNLAAQQAASTSVPNLIRYSGTLKGLPSAASAGSATIGVTFAIYNQQEGGAAVWQETQNVTVDTTGQYSVLLGNTTSGGLPDDLFSKQEERWLGVQVQGQEEQARVMLVSVPYAFKAHEADTLGGLPASAFVQAAQPGSVIGGSNNAGATGNGTAVNALTSSNGTKGLSNGAGRLAPSPIRNVKNGPCGYTGNPSQGYIALFIGKPAPTDIICNSVMFQNLGMIGVGRVPLAPAMLDVAGNVNVDDTRQSYMIGYQPVLTSPVNTNNLFVGTGAGLNNPANTGAGFDNTFVGFNAGFTATGDTNTFVGSQAGYGLTTGVPNSGEDNTFLGYKAGLYNTDGGANTYVGYQAGNSNDRGSANTFVGSGAGIFVAGLNSNGNTFLGNEAGHRLTSGQENTFVGDFAGFDAGNNNVCIGSSCGNNVTSGDNNIYIASVGCSSPCPSENATIRIGDQSGPSPSTTYIAGIYPAVVTDRQVFIRSDGRLGTMLSSRRYKEQVLDMGDDTSRLLKLRPVTFLYKRDYVNGARTVQFGLIAEEVAQVYPELVEFGEDGQPLTVKYQFLAPILLNELQKQHKLAQAQQQELQTQLAQITSQRQEIESLKLQLHEQNVSLQLKNASLEQRLQKLESYVDTQMKTASETTTAGAIGGVQ